MIKLFDKRNVLKNLFICITMVLVLTVTGCTSSAAKKAMEETRLAVSNGEYQEALTYAKLAVKEGVKDEKFLSLFQVLTDYQSAEDALSNNDPDKAQSILNEIKDLDGSGMTAAVKAAKERADSLLLAAKEFEDDIGEIEQDITKERFYIAYDEAEELLKETKLTVGQRERAEGLFKQAEEGKNAKKASSASATPKPATSASNSSSSSSSSSSSGGKAMATKDEAVEIAREFLGISKTAKYTYDVELVQDYYYVHFEVDYGGEELDEIGCKVDALGFYAYDPAG